MKIVRNIHSEVVYAITSWDEEGNPSLHSDLAGTGISAKISRENFRENFEGY